jgi:hypothetical protein
MHNLALFESRPQNAPDSVAAATNLIRIDCDNVEGYRKTRGGAPDRYGRGVFVLHLRQHDDQVYVAVGVLLAARKGSEEDDFERVELFNDDTYDVRQPLS